MEKEKREKRHPFPNIRQNILDFRFRHLIIRFWLPIAWRLLKNRKSDTLGSFAETELDSTWQSLRAMEHVEDPTIKAALFEHALEEVSHFELFSEAAQASSPTMLDRKYTRREIRLRSSDPKEILRFLVFLNVGESEINRDFSSYISAIADPKVRDILNRIQGDEVGHASGSERTVSLLAARLGANSRLMGLLQRLNNLRRRYELALSRSGETFFKLALLLIYLVLGLWGKKQAKHRMQLDQENQLKIFKEQEERFLRLVSTH